MPPSTPPRETLTFDIERVFQLEHSDELLDLAQSTRGHTVASAYDVILDLIASFTKKVTVRENTTKQSTELSELRTTLRRVGRLWRSDPFSSRGRIRGEEYGRLARLWRERRDLERRQEVEEVRKKFWSAHFSGEAFKAWRLAKSEVAGKGGGIKTSATQGISKDAWEAHFRSIYSGTGSVAPNLTEVQLSGINVPELDHSFTLEEVRRALETKKNHKAPGPDGLRIDFLRILRYDDVVCQALANFFNLVLARSEIPESWEKAYLFILYKGKGDKTSPDSFRGITLKSHLLKLFETLLQSRLCSWMEQTEALPDEQLAYRAAMSGVDHIYTLNVLRESIVAKKGKFFVALIDLKKAFPSIDRVSLLKDLVSAGVSDKMVAMLRRLYISDCFQLLLDGVPGTAVFVVVAGVHEGSCLSPLLFIFYIRDLPRAIDITVGDLAPRIQNRPRSTLVYADDVAEMALSHVGLQVEINACYDFFEGKLLRVNPDKSEVICFVKTRAVDFDFSCDFRGTQRPGVRSARYLGVVFDTHGKWLEQKRLVAARSRSALGRCKIILGTIGKGNAKNALNLFYVLVFSVYRYGLGAWGPVAGSLSVLDDLFIDFIRWLYGMPKTTSKLNILSCFGRRCAMCDALYLASIQLANSSTSKNVIRRDLVGELVSRQRKAKWFDRVLRELVARRLDSSVLRDGVSFVGQRKEMGVRFAQYCLHVHLNLQTNTSADLFRNVKPFGIFPFLLASPPMLARYALSFVLCNFRWIDNGKCRQFPRSCSECRVNNTAWHVLFKCCLFSEERDWFLA
jgi:hypothetical protein